VSSLIFSIFDYSSAVFMGLTGEQKQIKAFNKRLRAFHLHFAQSGTCFPFLPYPGLALFR